MNRALSPAVCLLGAAALFAADAKHEPAPAAPKPVSLEGRIIDIAKDFAAAYKSDKSERAKEPLYGLKTADGLYVILRTRDSERFWLDPRMRQHEMILNGRLFPDSRIIEVFNVQRRENGKLLDVYYWCDVCNIRAVTNDACACCQGEVELRETPAGKR